MKAGLRKHGRNGMLAAGLLAMGALAVFLALTVRPLPVGLMTSQPQTCRVRDYRGALLVELPRPGARSQTPVALEEMGAWFPQWVVALEDRRFYSHHGVDGRALLRAALDNLRHGTVRSGASTLTQQLVKIASDRTGRSPVSKAREMIWAWRLERRWSKDRILEEYLNRLPFGNLCVGVEAAARWYFGKPARELTRAETAFLAGIPRAPTKLNPWRYPEASAARYRITVQHLLGAGLLAAADAEDLLQRVPVVGRYVASAQWAGDDPLALVLSELSRHRRGDIPTTLDAARQKQVEIAARIHLTGIAASGATQAALVIMENATGAVRVLVPATQTAAPGSAINLAQQPRAAGSALKPFLYAAALDSRTVTAATLLPDTPEAIRGLFRDYAPENYDRRCHGPVRVREALASSLNIPAVVLLHRLGGATVAGAILERWGLKLARPSAEYGAGLVLGNAEVTLLDLTAAYAALARGGRTLPWRIEGKQSAVGERAASSAACALIADILADPEARRKTFGRSSPLECAVPIPVKTGTSSGFRDAWCIGFTRQHTCGVWVGNADGRPLQEWSSIRAAAPLWRAVVDLLLTTGDTPYACPEGEAQLHTVPVCKLSGHLPGSMSPSVVAEKFLPGTGPEPGADQFFERYPDGSSGVMLPEEYGPWCASRFNALGARAESPKKLVIVEPQENAVFELDPHLTRQQQVLSLRSAGPASEQASWWVDGKALGQTGTEAEWPLALGRHRIEVRSPGGPERASAVICVEAAK